MIMHQHEAAQFRAKMAINPFRQRRQDGASIRRNPAFALITGGIGRNHQVLHEKGFMALEARSLRHRRRLDHQVFDDDPRRHLAAEPPRLLFGGLRRLRRLIHAARFDGRTALQPFQTGDLFTLLANNLFQGGNLAKQLNQQSLKLWTAQIGERRWWGHIRKESYSIEPSKQKNERLPTLLPLLRMPASRIPDTQAVGRLGQEAEREA